MNDISFDEAKRIGDEGERATIAVALQKFKRRGLDWLIRRVHGKWKPYDLEVVQPTADGLSILYTVEVKRDNLYRVTEKVAVEVAHDGEPSGICGGADLFSVVLDDRVITGWCHNVHEAIRGFKRETCCGNAGKAECYLVPVEAYAGLKVVNVEQRID